MKNLWDSLSIEKHGLQAGHLCDIALVIRAYKVTRVHPTVTTIELNLPKLS